MKKWVCSVCGYVYEGEQPPVECPVCHVDVTTDTANPFFHSKIPPDAVSYTHLDVYKRQSTMCAPVHLLSKPG